MFLFFKKKRTGFFSGIFGILLLKKIFIIYMMCIDVESMNRGTWSFNSGHFQGSAFDIVTGNLNLNLRAIYSD